MVHRLGTKHTNADTLSRLQPPRRCKRDDCPDCTFDKDACICIAYDEVSLSEVCDHGSPSVEGDVKSPSVECDIKSPSGICESLSPCENLVGSNGRNTGAISLKSVNDATASSSVTRNTCDAEVSYRLCESLSPSLECDVKSPKLCDKICAFLSPSRNHETEGTHVECDTNLSDVCDCLVITRSVAKKLA